MMFFYCQSYQAFNLALSNSNNKKIVVITNSDNIVKACKFLKIDHILHEGINLAQWHKSKDKIEKEVDRLLDLIGDSEIHFSHTQFAYFCFFLVKKANERKMKVVFHDFEFLYNSTSLLDYFNVKFLYMKYLQLSVGTRFHLKLEVRKAEKDNFVISLRTDYINSSCYKVINDKASYYDQTQVFFKNYQIEYPEIRNLFIAQFFTENELNNSELMACIATMRNQSFYIKHHPKLKNSPLLTGFKELPEFIPVELFFNKVTGCIVSLHSASLVTASKFDKLKAISLIEIINSDDVFLQQLKSDLTKKSDGKILFPNKHSEFLKILDSKSVLD